MTNEIPKQIQDLADKVCLKLNEIEGLEEALKNANKAKYAMEMELSEILDISGYTVGSSIALKNGRTIKLKEFFSSSIPAQSTIDKCKDPIKQEELLEKKQQCLKWLDQNNLSEIIKNNIIANLPRGDQDLAKEISSLLLEKGVAHIREENVHPQTLTATLKEQLRDGVNIPFELFSVQTGTKLEIK